MKRKKNKKKLLGRLAVALLLLLVLTEGILVLVKRSDWRFLIKETVSGWFRSADITALSEAEGSYGQWTKIQLLNTGSVVENNTLQLINKDHKIKTDFSEEVQEYKTTGAYMNASIVQAFSTLASDIKAEYQQTLYINSSYRTPEKQSEILETSEKNSAAEVGASEHQAGLALDVYFNGLAGRAILKCDAGQFLYKNCCNYGFVIRYPLFKSDITNTVFEPWHIRYVGVPHAEIMYNEGMVLEEYMNYLSAKPYYRYGDYLITRQSDEPFVLPEDFTSGTISPDNMGGYVITLKMK